MNLLDIDALEEMTIFVDRNGQIHLQYHGARDAQMISRMYFALERALEMFRGQQGIKVQAASV